MAEGGSEVKVKPEPSSEPTPAADISDIGKIRIPESVVHVLEYEDRNVGVPHSRMEVQVMPTRLYLDYTVVPILLDAMTAVDRTRPPDPIEFVAAFLFKNKEKYTPKYKSES